MVFILQPSVYNKICNEIKTKKTNKESISLQVKHLYVIHRLNHVKIFKKDQYQKGVPMSTEVLADLIGRGSDVKNIMYLLEKLNFIIKVRKSKLQEYSARYKLHDSIATERLYHHDFCTSDSALLRKLEKHNVTINSFKKQLQMLNNHVSINALGVDYFKKKYNLAQRDLNFSVEPSDFGLKAIYDGRFFASRPDIKSRVYTNLTSLSRDHRKYVEIDSKPMLMTDISNSQILLTVPLFHKFWAKKSGKGLINLPDDIKAFQKLAESGKFYEYIANCVGIKFNNDYERSVFKKKVFAEIWFSKNSKRLTAIKRVFKEQFATAFDIIWKFKEEKYNEFAIKLQRFEASILVDKVWKKMFKSGKTVFTLHDAIICTCVEDLELAEEMIRNELIKFRIEPKFKREEEINFLVA